MNELQYANYSEYKQQLTNELHKNAEGFVRIGYLLKQARDTDVLKESGYASVFDFAAAEYNLTKDVVSRWIAINDRFSRGGYSPELDDKYATFGPTKLAEMLTLPDAVIDVLPETITRAELRDIKQDIREEEKISDLEVMIEATEQKPSYDSLFLRCLLVWMHQEAPKTARFEKVRYIKPVIITGVLDALAPTGQETLSIRIPGEGTHIVSIRGKMRPISIINLRNNVSTQVEWSAAIKDIENFQRSIAGLDVYSAWERVYDEDIFPADEPEIVEEEKNIVETAEAEETDGEVEETDGEVEEANEKTAVEPAQHEEKPKPKPLMNDELEEEQLRVYTVQFRCSSTDYKKLQTFAYNNKIKFKKIGER